MATEQLLHVRVDHGDIGRAVSELEEFVATYPLRERPLGLLMVALYRQGRQADALAAYQRGRRRLIDEMGLDPSTPPRRQSASTSNPDDPSSSRLPGSSAIAAL